MTGLLTPDGDMQAYARRHCRLLDDRARRDVDGIRRAASSSTSIRCRRVERTGFDPTQSCRSSMIDSDHPRAVVSRSWSAGATPGRVRRLWLRMTMQSSRRRRWSDCSPRRNDGIPVTLAVIPALYRRTARSAACGRGACRCGGSRLGASNHAGPDDRSRNSVGHGWKRPFSASSMRASWRLKGLSPSMLVDAGSAVESGSTRVSFLSFRRSASTSLSYGRVKGESPLAVVNSHVDLMDWHGTRGGRPTGRPDRRTGRRKLAGQVRGQPRADRRARASSGA